MFYHYINKIVGPYKFYILLFMMSTSTIYAGGVLEKLMETSSVSTARPILMVPAYPPLIDTDMLDIDLKPKDKSMEGKPVLKRKTSADVEDMEGSPKRTVAAGGSGAGFEDEDKTLDDPSPKRRKERKKYSLGGKAAGGMAAYPKVERLEFNMDVHEPARMGRMNLALSRFAYQMRGYDINIGEELRQLRAYINIGVYYPIEDFGVDNTSKRSIKNTAISVLNGKSAEKVKSFISQVWFVARTFNGEEDGSYRNPLIKDPQASNILKARMAYALSLCFEEGDSVCDKGIQARLIKYVLQNYMPNIALDDY